MRRGEGRGFREENRGETMTLNGGRRGHRETREER